MPKKTIVELPLEDRDEVVRFLGQLEYSDVDKKDEASDAVKSVFRNLLQNDRSSSGFMATFAVAVSLPEVSVIRRTLTAANPERKNPYDGMSREERRKLQHKERRQNRRNN